MLILILICSFFIVATAAPLILMKWLSIDLNYDNIWVNQTVGALFGILITPLYLRESRKYPSYSPSGKDNNHYFGLAIIAIGENILLYTVLTKMPFSLYVIGRSSMNIFIVIFRKIILRKNADDFALLSIGLQVIGYILLGTSENNYNWIHFGYFGLCMATSITSSIYNCILEKHNNTIDTEYRYLNKITYLFYQNNLYFLGIIPFCMYYLFQEGAIKPYLANNIARNISVLLTASMCIPISNFLKMAIIANDFKIDGNILFSGIELIRRVGMNLVAFLAFKDIFNISILMANIFILGSGIIYLVSLKYQYWHCLEWYRSPKKWLRIKKHISTWKNKITRQKKIVIIEDLEIMQINDRQEEINLIE